MTSARIFAYKLFIISFALLFLLLFEAKRVALFLPKSYQDNPLAIQLWGCVFVFGIIVFAISLLNIKKMNQVRVSCYTFMGLIFVCLPLLVASSPYSVIALLD